MCTIFNTILRFYTCHDMVMVKCIMFEDFSEFMDKESSLRQYCHDHYTTHVSHAINECKATFISHFNGKNIIFFSHNFLWILWIDFKQIVFKNMVK